MKVQEELKKLDEQWHDADKQFYGVLMQRATCEARLRGWDVNGWAALYLLFAERFHWTPAQTRSLSLEEISSFLDVFFSKKR